MAALLVCVYEALYIAILLNVCTVLYIFVLCHHAVIAATAIGPLRDEKEEEKKIPRASVFGLDLTAFRTSSRMYRTLTAIADSVTRVYVFKKCNVRSSN